MLTPRSGLGTLVRSVLVLPLAGFSLTGDLECAKYDESCGGRLVPVAPPTGRQAVTTG